jgi:ATP-dependent helicase/nuclease subunit A
MNVGEPGDIELGEPAAVDDVDRWRDWLQPKLLGGDLVGRAIREGQASGQIGKASYTVCRPPKPVDWRTDGDPVDSEPTISIPAPPTHTSGKRIAATTLVNEVADAAGNGHSSTESGESAGLSPTTFGTVVHRINELRPPRDEWEALVRRLSGMAGEEPTESDLRDVVDHATDAVDFVDQVEADCRLEATYDEYAVVARVGASRIVGDIDRLLVTPDAYHVVDYKTNDLSSTSTTKLASHYRPQMLAYALALLQHDPDRSVRASLRFTDVGVDERFEWDASELPTIESEVRSMVEMIVD